MTPHRKKIPIGLDKDTGQIRFINDVVSGLKCNCVCPGCESTLVAKKGESGKVAHHFSHHNSTATQSCLETALHILAKHWISINGRVWLPPYVVCKYGQSILNEPFDAVIHDFNKTTALSTIEKEKPLPTLGIQPDILCNINLHGEIYQLAIEVAVTHKVDADKRTKAEGSNLNIIEINLKHLLDDETWTMNTLGDAICNAAFSEWIHVNTTLGQSLSTRMFNKGAKSWKARNQEVYQWYASIQDHFTRKPIITLPKYRYSQANLQNTVTDIKGRTHNVCLGMPPDIGGVYAIAKVGLISKAGITFTLKWKRKEYSINVRLTQLSNTAPSKSEGPVLRLKGALPLPDRFAQNLVWVRSEKNHQYKEQCEAQRESVKNAQNKIIESDFIGKWDTIRECMSLEETKQPISQTAANLNIKIERLIRCKSELQRMGYALDEISGPVPRYWIFGCNHDVWQLPLFIELTKKPEITITAESVNKALKTMGFSEMPEIKYLSINIKVFSNICSLRAKQLPKVYQVINAYLDGLVEGGYLDPLKGYKYKTYILTNKVSKELV